MLLIYQGRRSQDVNCPSTWVAIPSASRPEAREVFMVFEGERYCEVQFLKRLQSCRGGREIREPRGFVFRLDCKSPSRVSVRRQGSNIYSDHPLHGSGRIMQYPSNVSTEHPVSHPAQGDFHVC